MTTHAQTHLALFSATPNFPQKSEQRKIWLFYVLLSYSVNFNDWWLLLYLKLSVECGKLWYQNDTSQTKIEQDITYFLSVNSLLGQLVCVCLQYADDSHVAYILQLLNQPNDDVVMFASGIIGNLSSEKPRLKMSIFSQGGVEIVLQTMIHAKR